VDVLLLVIVGVWSAVEWFPGKDLNRDL